MSELQKTHQPGRASINQQVVATTEVTFAADITQPVSFSGNFSERMKERNRDVVWGLASFVLGILAVVVVVDLVVVVWLGSGSLLSKGSFIFMACVAGLMLAASAIQFLRFSKDGRKLSSSLGGRPASEVADRKQKLRERLVRITASLDNLCRSAGCPVPALNVQMNRKDINAFACGLNPEHWCITITRGAVMNLEDQEMDALLAHELAHLTTRDTRHALLICAYLAGLASISTVCSLLAGNAGESKEGVALAVIAFFIAFMGLGGWLVGQLLEAHLSRRQEFRADAEGSRLLQCTDGMVSLLRRLLLDQSGIDNSGDWDSFDAFCVKSLYFGQGARSFWFDSHPPLLDRIRALDAAEADRLRAILAERGPVQ